MLNRIYRNLPLTNALYSHGKQRWSTGGGSKPDLAGSQSGKVQVDEGSIYFERRGTGKHPILCMPGALGTALTDFKHQFEYFGNSEAYSIVGYDPLGYGSSRPPQRPFNLGAAQFLRKDAVHAHAVMKALGYDRFSVLGWSDGGGSGPLLGRRVPRIRAQDGGVGSQRVRQRRGHRDVPGREGRDPMEPLHASSA
eukprot:Em0003g1360a